MAYQVEVDQDLCISSGKCVADAPALFRFDDDDLSEVIAGAPRPPDDELLAIARQCPALAVVLRDESGDLIELD